MSFNTTLETAVINLHLAGLLSTEFLISRESRSEFDFKINIEGIDVLVQANTRYSYIQPKAAHFRLGYMDSKPCLNKITEYEKQTEQKINKLGFMKKTEKEAQIKASRAFWEKLKRFIETNI